jgi:hypothetical protein
LLAIKFAAGMSKIMRGRRASAANGMRITQMIRSKGAQKANACSWVEDMGDVELLKIPAIEDRIEDLVSSFSRV